MPPTRFRCITGCIRAAPVSLTPKASAAVRVLVSSKPLHRPSLHRQSLHRQPGDVGTLGPTLCHFLCGTIAPIQRIAIQDIGSMMERVIVAATSLRVDGMAETVLCGTIALLQLIAIQDIGSMMECVIVAATTLRVDGMAETALAADEVMSGQRLALTQAAPQPQKNSTGKNQRKPRWPYYF